MSRREPRPLTLSPVMVSAVLRELPAASQARAGLIAMMRLEEGNAASDRRWEAERTLPELWEIQGVVSGVLERLGCGPQLTSHKRRAITCPACHEPRAFAYLNPGRPWIGCNRRNACELGAGAMLFSVLARREGSARAAMSVLRGLAAQAPSLPDWGDR